MTILGDNTLMDIQVGLERDSDTFASLIFENLQWVLSNSFPFDFCIRM